LTQGPARLLAESLRAAAMAARIFPWPCRAGQVPESQADRPFSRPDALRGGSGRLSFAALRI